MDVEQRIDAYLWAHRQVLVDLLRDMIRCPSVNPDLQPGALGEKGFQMVLQEWFSDCAVTIQSWDPDAEHLQRYQGQPGFHPHKDFRGRPLVVIRREGHGGEGHDLMFMGHSDVVPAPEDNWVHPPFAGEYDSHRIFGRGAVDMKSGLAAASLAVRALADLDIELDGDVLLASVPDEEAGGMGTLALLDAGIRADAAIIPEPTDLRIAPLCRGILWGKITIEGKSGHIEMPQPSWEEGGAVDALNRAYMLYTIFQHTNQMWTSDPRKRHPLLREPNQIKVAAVRGGTYATSYADHVEMIINVQYLPAERDEHLRGGHVQHEVEHLVAELTQSDSWLQRHPPRIEWLVDADCGETPQGHPLVNSVHTALVSTGHESIIEGIHSHTDMGLLINAGIPTVNFGPGSPYMAHQINESVAIDDMLVAARTMARVALDWGRYRG